MKSKWSKLILSLSDPNGEQGKAIRARQKAWPRRLLRLFFGEFTQMVLLEPGQMVYGIEVRELKEKEAAYGKDERTADDA